MSSVINKYAPECSYPGCTNKVGYHKKYNKQDGSLGAKWKSCCEFHRKVQKPAMDKFKMKSGCANVDAHHGFKCTSNITSPGQLDINHIDGNRYNNSPENREVLCKVCHQQVTIDNEHYLNRYSHINPNFNKHFEEVKHEQ
jgi:hypothetical protein